MKLEVLFNVKKTTAGSGLFFYDYYNAGAFISGLYDFLDRDTGVLVANGLYKEAFELSIAKKTLNSAASENTMSKISLRRAAMTLRFMCLKRERL